MGRLQRGLHEAGKHVHVVVRRLPGMDPALTVAGTCRRRAPSTSARSVTIPTEAVWAVDSTPRITIAASTERPDVIARPLAYSSLDSMRK